MSDNSLRELERRWRESGSVVDEAAYHGERVRLGQLDAGSLAAAAYLGHPAARLLSPQSEPINMDLDVEEWISDVQLKLGESALRCALAAIGLDCCDVWSRADKASQVAAEARRTVIRLKHEYVLDVETLNRLMDHARASAGESAGAAARAVTYVVTILSSGRTPQLGRDYGALIGCLVALDAQEPGLLRRAKESARRTIVEHVLRLSPPT